MYYRRKLILALLQAFPEKLDRLRFQKLLFLLSQSMKSPAYHFLPYKYGCFSFQANADMLTLEKTGFISKTENGWTVNENMCSHIDLDIADHRCLELLKNKFGNLTNDELIIHTYTHYPFYAINSEIAYKYLDVKGLQKVEDAKSKDVEKTLFTLGYEGLALEQYINLLLKKNVRLLLDVRKNAMSMKYGYSKSTLKSACENAGIVYEHFPEVGIGSDKRQNLQTTADYESLFSDYCVTTLETTIEIQKEICYKIEHFGRAALLCFEKSPTMCHRSRLAASLMHHFSSPVTLQHLHG